MFVYYESRLPFQVAGREYQPGHHNTSVPAQISSFCMVIAKGPRFSEMWLTLLSEPPGGREGKKQNGRPRFEGCCRKIAINGSICMCSTSNESFLSVEYIYDHILQEKLIS